MAFYYCHLFKAKPMLSLKIIFSLGNHSHFGPHFEARQFGSGLEPDRFEAAAVRQVGVSREHHRDGAVRAAAGGLRQTGQQQLDPTEFR